MTYLSRILAFFPMLHGMLVLGCLLSAMSEIGFPLFFCVWILATLFMLYVFPVIAFRIHDLYFPLKAGFSSLNSNQYSPWWGSHQIQLLFVSFPAFETILRLIPGAYSAWLRLWGAQIGRGIYWTPSVQIIDRPLISVGDYAVLGHESALCAHVVMRKNEKLRLLVKGISIGAHCLIGARTRLGPGVVVHAHVDLPYNTEGWINQEFRSEVVVASE